MKLKGRRTYITVVTGMLLVIGEFLTKNTFNAPAYVDLIQQLLPWLAGGFLRAGIPNKNQ